MNDWNINYERTLYYLSNLLNYLEERYSRELTNEEKANNSCLYLTEENILKSLLNKKDSKDIEKVYYFISEISKNIEFIKLNEQLNSILNILDEEKEENNILDLSLD